MKSNELFYPNLTHEDPTDDDWNFSGMDYSDEQHPMDTVYNPVQVVGLGEESVVSLVSNGQVVQHGLWKDVSAWIQDHWDELSGVYQLVSNGATVHEIKLAR
jgi:hypothetical protein